MTTPTTIDIAICTFRRPHIADTLRSLAKLQLPENVKVRIIVAENDDVPSVQSLVNTTAKECGLNVTYIHAPARNISIARNACLNAATAPLLAFIDDDELATSQWLNKLLETMETSGADIVLGPVIAIYEASCPQWIKEGDFHSTMPVWAGNTITTGYTCNVLIKRLSPSVSGLRFRLDLGRSGGEDTVYFSTVFKMGGKIAFAPEAVITEAVLPERASLQWLAKRRYRSGQTHGLILMENAQHSFTRRIRYLMIAAIKCAYSLLYIPIWWKDKSRGAFWILRAKLHCGVVARLLGAQSSQLYGRER